ncbi:hypothetical protein AALO_G00156200 [Alosa alosa]|nr:hypothetical protein AALO_G00156200 [Alosa alosa]
MYQSLVDCQQPAVAVPAHTSQLKQGSVPLGRSPNVEVVLREDRMASASAGNRSALSPCEPFRCLAQTAFPTRP